MDNHRPNNEQIKAQWERQAAEVFIQWYNTQFEHHLSFLQNNRPTKPDVSCLLDGKKIDIEIAHLYGSEQEAMSILGKDLSEHTIRELSLLNKTSNAEERLVSALNRILEQKSHKRYNSEHTWLVIRNAHPRWNTAKIRAASSQILLTKNHPFEQIWIIGDLDAKSGALQLRSE